MIQKLKNLELAIRRQNLISSNEEVEDLSDENLEILSLPYFLGLAFQSLQNLQT